MNQNIDKENSATVVDKPLKVAFLCHSDVLGGASVVTHRLLRALRDEGVDARLVVFKKISDDPDVEEVKAGRFRRGAAFMFERIRIALANGFSRENLFKVSIASDSLDIKNNETVRNADVIVLSWINQGLMSFKSIEWIARLGKPVVWVMHDMWNLTGICHHALECRAYYHTCGNCQFLRGNRERDLSRRVWERKKQLYDTYPMTFVAVSNWLAECCRNSSLLAGRDVRVIYNAFPVQSFSTTPSLRISSIPENKKLILMGAARLDDPIKGIDIAVEALNHLFDNYPDVARRSMVVFFGDFRDKAVLDTLRFPYYTTGVINDGQLLRRLYAIASVVLSTSLYETLPGTLIEGQAAGCLPVTFGRGGQGDIVEHKKTGYIARYKDAEDIAEGIRWALAQNVDRESLHEHVRERFSAKTIARKYIDLFNELLGR